MEGTMEPSSIVAARHGSHYQLTTYSYPRTFITRLQPNDNSPVHSVTNTLSFLTTTITMITPESKRAINLTPTLYKRVSPHQIEHQTLLCYEYGKVL